MRGMLEARRRDAGFKRREDEEAEEEEEEGGEGRRLERSAGARVVRRLMVGPLSVSTGGHYLGAGARGTRVAAYY